MPSVDYTVLFPEFLKRLAGGEVNFALLTILTLDSTLPLLIIEPHLVIALSKWFIGSGKPKTRNLILKLLIHVVAKSPTIETLLLDELHFVQTLVTQQVPGADRLLNIFSRKSEIFRELAAQVDGSLCDPSKISVLFSALTAVVSDDCDCSALLQLSRGLLTEHESVLAFCAKCLEVTPSCAASLVDLTPALLSLAVNGTKPEFQTPLYHLLKLLADADEKAKAEIRIALRKYVDVQIDCWAYDPVKQIPSEAGLRGLRNLGSTCYINVILQQLFMISSFRECLFRCTTQAPLLLALRQ
jgi:hypothetical protein